MSGGEQQQLAIGRALIGNPSLMLLDEPSEGIQPSIVQLICTALRAFCRELGHDDTCRRTKSRHHSRFERPLLRHGERPDRRRHSGRRGQCGLSPSPFDALTLPATPPKNVTSSVQFGEHAERRLKLRLKWPRSLKPCAKAASVTERASPCIRATRLASSRSDHTQRIGVAPSVPNRRLRLRTDIAPAAASASGLRSG